MPTGTWTIGSPSSTRTQRLGSQATHIGNATFQVSTPGTYTIDSIGVYVAAETVNTVLVSCELYSGSTLIASTTEQFVTTTTLGTYIFSRTSHNNGGSWVVTISGNTELRLQLKLRNTSTNFQNCSYSAWYDVDGILRPYGIISYTTTGSGAKIWNGSSWVKHPVKVWNGSSWVRRPVKVWNGSSWVTR